MPKPDSVSKTILAEDQFTDPLTLQYGETCTVSVKGDTFSGTVSLKRQLPGQSTYSVLTQADGTPVELTTDAEFDYYASERQQLIIGVETGDFTGTSVDVRLGKG